MSNTTPASERRPVRIWANALIACFTAQQTSPPVNSRAAGLTFEAVYNTWACLQDSATARLSIDLPGLQELKDQQNPATRSAEAQLAAISYAAYTVVSNLYAAQTAILANAIQLSAEGLVELSANPVLTLRAQNLGNAVARIILDHRINDGSNQLGNYADTTGFVASNVFDLVNDANNIAVHEAADNSGNLWLPLTQNSVTQVALTPHWGQVRPLVMGYGAAQRANLRVQPSVAEVTEILGYSANLTDRRKAIAEYFARGAGTESPPGQWLGIARDISQTDGLQTDAEVKLFWGIGAALMDAGIAAWDTKYNLLSPRPITYIRNNYRGQTIDAWAGPGLAGNSSILGNTWISYGAATNNDQSPPFPELVSGHSTFGAASMGFLAAFRKSDAVSLSLTVTANSIAHDPGFPQSNVVLNYANLTALVADAGLSRLYKGIHFAQANEAGQVLGRSIGIRVFDRLHVLVSVK